MCKDGTGWTALMWAAANGHASYAELLISVSNALAKNNNGVTALMLAAACGHASCAEFLTPVSGVLAKDNNGDPASEVARNAGYPQLADFIDAYTLALSEISVLDSLVTPRGPRKKASVKSRL